MNREHLFFYGIRKHLGSGRISPASKSRSDSGFALLSLHERNHARSALLTVFLTPYLTLYSDHEQGKKIRADNFEISCEKGLGDLEVIGYGLLPCCKSLSYRNIYDLAASVVED